MPRSTSNRYSSGVSLRNANSTCNRTIVRLGYGATNISCDFSLNIFRNTTTYVVGYSLGASFTNRTSDGVLNRLVADFANRTANRVGVVAIVCFTNNAVDLYFPLLVNNGNFVSISGNLLRLHYYPTSCLHYGVAAVSSAITNSGTVTGSRCRTTALIRGAATTALGPASAC